MKDRPLPPLQQELIVVQSDGMQKWLSLQLADTHGIFANVAFMFPKTLVHKVFKDALNAQSTAYFSTEALTWSVMKVLPGLLDERSFSSLSHYLESDPSGLKLFQLGRQIAETLARYALLRPDVILAWSRGENPLTDEAARWQAILWRRLLENCPEETRALDPAALKQRLMQSPDPLPGLPSRISVFGISTLAPYYVDVFIRMARQADMDLYYMNPCRQYWEYVYSQKELARFTVDGVPEEAAYMEEGNRLLASMGTAGREFFSLLLGRVGDIGEDLFEDPGCGDMLTTIQSDILNLVDTGLEKPQPVLSNDTSIQVNACHSLIREVEVLYDTLLRTMEIYPDVQPRDIVVMMPDVSAYAPLIQAVFDNPESPAKRIAYSIADATVRQANNVADAMLSILSMDRNRYRAPDVLDLLDKPAVRNRFGLNEHDLDRVKDWVVAVGIRWGIDGQYRGGLGLPGFEEHTWAFGLDRMLLGHALFPTPDEQMFGGILPWGQFEAENTLVLGKVAHFARTLFDRCRSLKAPKTVPEWIMVLNDILTGFFLADNDAAANDILEIRRTVLDDGLSGIRETTGYEDPVSLDVMRDYLEARLAGTSRTTGFISNGVTFCTLLPMRSIPFKVVGMLGMNDGAFPRAGRRPGFDLLEKRRRPCDFSKMFEDRYLFLESLLSARKALIISYIGQDIRENSSLPPASAVSELLEYLSQRFITEDGNHVLQQVINRHPLQPFSARYFQNSGRFSSYSEENCAAACRNLEAKVTPPCLFDQPLPDPPAGMWQPLTLDLLAVFFKNPAAFIMKNRLNLNLAAEADGRVDDREPFDLDALQAYMIKQDMIETLVRGGKTESAFDLVMASGRLPHGSLGEVAWTKCEQSVRVFMEKISPFLEGGPAEPEHIECRLNDARNTNISGTLNSLYAGGQIFYRCAKIKAMDILNAWIYHLALNATGKDRPARITRLVGSDDVIEFSEMAEEVARSYLAELADLFFKGLSEPVCFFPETSYALAESIAAGKPLDKAKSTAAGQWRPGKWHTGEGEDVHISRCFDETILNDEKSQRIALDVFGPVLEYIKS